MTRVVLFDGFGTRGLLTGFLRVFHNGLLGGFSQDFGTKGLSTSFLRILAQWAARRCFSVSGGISEELTLAATDFLEFLKGFSG